MDLQRCLLSIFLLVLPMFLAAQYKASRDLGSFEKVSASGNVKVFLSEGPAYEILLETEGVELGKVVTEVKGGELRIKLKTGVYKNDQKVVLQITAPRFSEIKAAASSWVGTNGALSGERIAIIATSGAVADLQLNCLVVDARATEAGDLYLSGQSDRMDAVAVSAGRIFSSSFFCKQVYVKVNTGGVAEVAPTDLLDATASSAGKVLYLEKPPQLSMSTSMGGTVEKKP